MSVVAARVAQGVMSGGSNNTQINIFIPPETPTDSVPPDPLVADTGKIQSPYRGLSWFTREDAKFFFGRETTIDAVLQRLSDRLGNPSLLMVSGVSGAGKTSLLRAGILTRIEEVGLDGLPEAKHWPQLVFTPGASPLDALALRTAQMAGLDAASVRRGLEEDPTRFALTAMQAAVGQGDTQSGRKRRLLLFVDQFEQLFTLCENRTHREAFITALHAAATTIPGDCSAPAALVVLLIRADFESRCADYEELIDALQRRYLVTAMTERQLRLAITQPAKEAGSQVEDDLTEQLLREVRTHTDSASPPITPSGVLPLLSHALDEAWRHRVGDTLTLADYERVGGIGGAVPQSAETAWASLSAHRQTLAQQIFIQLTVTGPDGRVTASPAQRHLLTALARDPTDAWAVLETFAAQRLLTLGVDTVEISHEIVITAWARLHSDWLAETRSVRAICTRLNTAATEWDSTRDPDLLYNGSTLSSARAAAEAVEAEPSRYPPLLPTEKAFLDASTRVARRRLWTRVALTSVTIVAVVGLIIAAVAVIESNRESAHRQDVAVARQLISQSENLATADPFGSKLAALAAWRLNPTAESRHAMLAAAIDPHTAVLTGHTGMVYAAAFSPDGKILATGSYDESIRFWDPVTREQLGDPLLGHDANVMSLAFSPDGRTLASGGNDGEIRLWDVSTRRPIGGPLRHGDIVGSLAFSPDGRSLASGTLDGTVRLWDPSTRQKVGQLITPHVSAVFSLAFSPDSATLAIATSSPDGAVQLWDRSSQQPIGDPLIGHTDSVYSVKFSPDGKTLATGSFDKTIRLWDLATRQPIGAPLTGHTATVLSAAFSPDSKILATASNDRTVRLWDLSTQRPIGDPLTGHTDSVAVAAFSPDGKTLATTSADGTVRLWDPTLGHAIGDPLTGHTAAVAAVAFSPDGKSLVTGSDDHTARLSDLVTRRPIGRPLIGHSDALLVVAFSSDGKTLITGSDDRTVRRWDLARRQTIDTFVIGVGTGHSVALSPDGTVLAANDYGGPIEVWNLATRERIGKFTRPDDVVVGSVAVDSDGAILIIGDFDGSVLVWDVSTGTLIGNPLTGHTGKVLSAAFSPDGRTLATGSEDTTVRLWDVATRRPIGNPLTGHTNTVASIAFSPDGRTLATGSEDTTVRLWDVATRRPIGNPLTGHTNTVASIAFSPDGRTLATGSDDKTTRLWNLASTVDPASALCEWAHGSFNRDRWNQYVPPGPPYRELCP